MKTLTNRIFPSLALGAAILALVACKNEPETMNTAPGDPDAAELANAAPPPPLPMIKATRTYRCKDNSLAIVDFMTDDVSASYKATKDGPVTALKATEAGKPFVSADGKTTLTGNGDVVTLNGTSCKKG